MINLIPVYFVGVNDQLDQDSGLVKSEFSLSESEIITCLKDFPFVILQVRNEAYK